MSSFPISITWSVGTPPTGVFGQLATAAKQLDTALLASGQKFNEFGTTISQLESPLQGAGAGMGELASNMEGLDSSLGNSGAAMGELADSTEQMASAVEGTGSSIDEFGSSLQDAGSSAQDAVGGITDFGSGVEDSIGSVDSMNSSLGELGGIFGEAGTATEEYTGALASMSDAQLAVSGGLTENTTLMGNLATATDETARGQEGFNTALAQVGTGMVGLVGAGIQLFNAYDDLGDSAMRVEAANARLDRSQTMLESKMLTLSKTTRDMASDSSLMISGIGEWVAAQTQLNNLMEQGVTSGTEWESALQQAGAAQDAMSSSTAKGTEAITRAGIQLDQAAVAAKRVEVNTWQVTNAEEAQAQAWARLVTALVTITGISGNLSTTMGGVKLAVDSGRNAIHLFRGGIADLIGWIGRGGIALGGIKAAMVTVGGAFVAVAVPVGIAIAALAAFVGAITAIRVNIKVFDDMGKAIGSVFPQAVGFLNDLRQGFINLSDGTNTAISLMLGGIDALTGGVFKMQEGWDKWTQTLPKGTGELGKVGLTAAMVAEELGLTNDSLEIAADKTKVVGGNLFDLNGNLLATAGNFDTLANGNITYLKAAEDAGKATTETAASLDTAGASARKYIPLSENLTAASENQALASADLADLTNIYNQALQGNIPALIDTVQGQTEAAIASGEMADATDTASGSAEDMGGSLDVAAEGTSNLGAGAEGATEALTPMEQALAAAVQKLKAEEEAAKAAHAQNVLLLGLWGVKIPQALLGSREAIQALVNVHAEENAAVNESKVKALEYIATHGTMQDMLKALQGNVISYAESMGYEAEAADEATKATKEFEEKLKALQKVTEDAAPANMALANAMKEEREEAERASIARHDAAIELGIYNDMIQLAIPLHDQLIKLVQDEKNERQGQITELQKLARERGLENDQLTDNIGVLNRYIQTHKLLPPTLEDASTAYSKLLAQKQQEAKDTEISRQALALYVKTQYGVVDATEASIGQLEAFITTMERIAGATDTAKTALASWMGDLIASRVEEEALRKELLALADTLGIAVPDAANQTSESLKILIEDATGLGDAMERQREKIKALVEAIYEGADAFTDFITSMDFKEVDDKFEDLVDGIREGIDDMIEIAEKEGVEVSDKFAAALDFSEVTKAAVGQMKEFWPILDKSMVQTLESHDFAFISQGIDVFTANVKHALEDADIPHAAQSVVDGILLELEKLKTIKDPKELVAAMGRIKEKVDALATSTSGLDATTKSLTSLNNVPADKLSTIAQSIEQLATTVSTLHLELTPAQIDAWAQSLSQLTGVPVDQLKASLQQRLQEVGDSSTQKLLEAGPGGDAARTAFGNQMVALAQVMSLFQQGVDIVISTIAADFDALVRVIQTDAISISGAVSNMARNTTLSMGTMASGILIILAAFTKVQTDSQRMATTVSGSFSNMATNTASSMGRMASSFIVINTAMTNASKNAQTMNSQVSSAMSSMASKSSSFASSFSSAMSKVQSSATNATSKVKALQSAINALKSKTITITTIYRRVYQTVYAAHGTAFVTSNPTNIGGARVSEFGQQELVTVTPLQGPGRNKIKGLSEMLGEETTKKGRRAMEAEREGETAKKGKEMVMMRETPIVIQIDGREITRVVNRRIFEESDTLT